MSSTAAESRPFFALRNFTRFSLCRKSMGLYESLGLSSYRALSIWKNASAGSMCRGRSKEPRRRFSVGGPNVFSDCAFKRSSHKLAAGSSPLMCAMLFYPPVQIPLHKLDVLLAEGLFREVHNPDFLVTYDRFIRTTWKFFINRNNSSEIMWQKEPSECPSTPTGRLMLQAVS